MAGVLAAGEDITDQRAAEALVRNSLQEKEVLLKEIHHRVKNNLQIICSMLSLQAGTLRQEEAIQALQVSRERVRSMALIHEKLYQSKDLSRIDFPDYMRDLVGQLGRAYLSLGRTVEVRCDLREPVFSVEKAIPSGLIINELVSNALKHAFPGDGPGKVLVAMSQDKEGAFELSVSDNGVGFPGDLDPEKSDSLGLKLVAMLTKQLGGRLVLENGVGAGATFRIFFPGVQGGV